MMGKSQSQVVKVMRVLGAEDNKVVAYARGRRDRQVIFLGAEQNAALGDEIAAYFEGELIFGRWWLGEKLPNSNNRKW